MAGGEYQPFFMVGVFGANVKLHRQELLGLRQERIV